MATVLTDDGRAWITDTLAKASNGGATTPARWLGWGTTAGVTAVRGHTSLDGEDSGGSPAYARVSCTVSRQQTTTANDTYRTVGTLTSNGSKTITNAGIWDAQNAGKLVIKGDHTGIPLLANDSIEYTFDLHFT